jgi:cbb3-type cytochrome oxidase maturation protein
MNIIYFLLPIALLLGFTFAAAFVYFSSRGQFDDLETPAHRMLFDADLEMKSELAKKMKIDSAIDGPRKAPTI